MLLYLSDLSNITEEAPISIFLHCVNYTEGIVMLPRRSRPCEEKQVQKWLWSCCAEESSSCWLVMEQDSREEVGSDRILLTAWGQRRQCRLKAQDTQKWRGGKVKDVESWTLWIRKGRCGENQWEASINCTLSSSNGLFGDHHGPPISSFFL